jgi:hypothetical protein
MTAATAGSSSQHRLPKRVWGTTDIATPGVVAPANRVYRAKARHYDLGYCPIGYALATGLFVQGHYHHADFELILCAGLA